MIHDQRAKNVGWNFDKGRENETDKNVRPELGGAHADPVVPAKMSRVKKKPRSGQLSKEKLPKGDHYPVNKHDQNYLPGEGIFEEIRGSQFDLGFGMFVMVRFVFLDFFAFWDFKQMGRNRDLKRDD